MIEKTKKTKQKSYWLVEANWDGNNDQIQRYIAEGIWENGYEKISDLVNNIQPDDLIAIKSTFTKKLDENKFISTLRIKATGTVIKNFKNGKHLEVRWNTTNKIYDIENIIKTDTISQLTDENEINMIFYPHKKSKSNSPDIIENESNQNSKHPLNQIFFGPSGTGKTYKALTTALEIIDGFFPENHAEAKKKYETYKDNGQIGFITFHDSYGYDEFVEGLKMIQSEKIRGQIEYVVKPGIFKEISELSNVELLTPPNKINFDPDNEKIKFFKISLGTTSKERDDHTYSYCLSNNYIAMDKMGGIDYSILENTLDWEQAKDEIREVYFYDEDEQSKRLGIQAVYYFKNYMRSNDIFFVSNDNNNIIAIGRVNGWYEFKDIPGVRFHHFRKVEWLIKGCKIPSEKFYRKKFSEQPIYELNRRYLMLDNISNFISTKNSRKRNHVLIIDEINRGNINKIFGELLTLIEPQKRLGALEELRVKLPYSNEEFGVPQNLYIIGTMNSSSKISLFDSTLRRRFDFIEIDVDYKQLNFKIDGIEIDKMLSMINQRLVYLLDKEQQIGHSYFLELKDKPSFEMVRLIFKNKIIPLLQNYFSDDFEKISLVFGDNQKKDRNLQFIQVRNVKSSQIFGKKLPDVPNKKEYSVNLPDQPLAYIMIYKSNK